MGLQALTISAVEKLKGALGDLIIPLTLRTRVAVTYTPGSPITYTPTDVSVRGVISKFKSDEINGTLIKVEDVQILLFPDASAVEPKPNDSILNGAKEFRVVNNSPMYVGTAIVYNLIQGRPI